MSWPFLFSLLGLALVVQFWLAATRAWESAQAEAMRICADSGVQMLDQSVVLREFRPARAPWGIAFRRRYSYDYSIDGVGRQRGFLVYLGPRLESASVPDQVPPS